MALIPQMRWAFSPRAHAYSDLCPTHLLMAAGRLDIIFAKQVATETMHGVEV